MDIEDVGCSYKLKFYKGERNDVGYSKINTIAIQIKNKNNHDIRDMIDRLSSYLDYEGFKKTVDDTRFNRDKHFTSGIHVNELIYTS